MKSKVVWIATAIALGVLIGAALTYYYDNYYTSSLSPSKLLLPLDQADLNWAGYTLMTNTSDPSPLVSGVSGSWVVPQVGISQSDTFSAVWIGIGGAFDKTLIQTGTEQDCGNGTLYYFAWYELLPYDSVAIEMIDVSPGDTITASITLVNSAENVWALSIKDLSTGQSFDHNFSYDSSELSAEWVVERPEVGTNNTTMITSMIANFKSVTMSNCKATIDGKPRALGYFPSFRSFMYDQEGTRLVDVSYYSSDGSSFTVKYLTSQ